MAASPLDTRPVYQWEWDSTSAPPPDPGNAPFNCGVCAVVKIAEYYTGDNKHVNNTRRLVAPDLTATTVGQQKRMLELLGVPCELRTPSASELTSLLSSGRRPIVIGLDMSRVPLAIAGHDFRGPHGVVAQVNVIRNGVAGKLIMDPNFSPRTGRVDPTGGKRFYPDNIINYAMGSPSTMRWSVVPIRIKALPVVETYYVRFNAGVDGVNIRSAPDGRRNNVFAIAYSDADPRPNGIVRVANKQTIAKTSTRIPLRTGSGVVTGPDGKKYYRIRIPGTAADTYVNTVFMHRI